MPSPTKYFLDTILFKSYLFLYLIFEFLFGSKLSVIILKKIRKIEITTKTKKFDITHKIEQIPYLFDIYYNPIYGIQFEDGVLIDVGAHIGSSTFGFLKNNLMNKFYLIEPKKENFRLLKINIKNNNLNGQVKLFNIAFSNKEGFDYLYSSLGSGGHTIFPIGKERTRIKTTTLDKFFKKERINKISLIKIDTEGSELKILQGAKSILKTQAPKLLIELHPFFVKPSSVINYLEIYGYKIKILSNLTIFATKDLYSNNTIILKEDDKKV